MFGPVSLHPMCLHHGTQDRSNQPQMRSHGQESTEKNNIHETRLQLNLMNGYVLREIYLPCFKYVCQQF